MTSNTVNETAPTSSLQNIVTGLPQALDTIGALTKVFDSNLRSGSATTQLATITSKLLELANLNKAMALGFSLWGAIVLFAINITLVERNCVYYNALFWLGVSIGVVCTFLDFIAEVIVDTRFLAKLWECYKSNNIELINGDCRVYWLYSSLYSPAAWFTGNNLAIFWASTLLLFFESAIRFVGNLFLFWLFLTATTLRWYNHDGNYSSSEDGPCAIDAAFLQQRGMIFVSLAIAAIFSFLRLLWSFTYKGPSSKPSVIPESTSTTSTKATIEMKAQPTV